ncbi:jg19036 [Pararge aegeria aegeria]|uniref:Jg19036 protein n=1 Tax=Pararge aegeria aegeria TaxID=348720 RepID=A0A8S4R416_9NEOP|nr:jg19036 [Pararge aegeria aegeria]
MSARSARPGLHNVESGMAARVSEGAGPSYASVLNFRGGDSNKENIENIESSEEVADVPPRQDDEEEEGFVPVISHTRRPAKSRRDRERRAAPRPQKTPQSHSEPQTTTEQQQADDQPKKFVEAPIPKVNPWQCHAKFEIKGILLDIFQRMCPGTIQLEELLNCETS